MRPILSVCWRARLSLGFPNRPCPLSCSASSLNGPQPRLLGGSLGHSKMTSSSHFACQLPSSSPFFLLSTPPFLGPFFPYCSIKLCFIAVGKIAAGRHPMPVSSFFHSNRFPLGMPRIKAPFPISYTRWLQLWQHTLFWLKGSETSSLILKGKGCDLLLPLPPSCCLDRGQDKPLWRPPTRTFAGIARQGMGASWP